MRVLVVRVGAMGDVCHALPAVAALRRARPEWEIGWAVDRRWVSLLEADGARPEVDRVHVVPTRDWSESPVSRRTLRQIQQLRTELRGRQYDVCVDMQGTIRSAVIGRMAGAGALVGYRDPREAPAGWIYSRRMERKGVHVVDQGCALLGEAVHVKLQPGAATVPVSAMAEMWAEEMLAEVGRFCFVAPTAGWGAKMWPAERFGTLARELEERGLRVVVNAGGAHDEVAKAVVQASGGRAVAMGSTVAQMVALLRRASVVVAGDTGPLHVAAVLGRPVVGLFGPTDPARNGPFGTRARVFRHSSSRTDHSRTQAAEGGLLQIDVSEVADAAIALAGVDFGAGKVPETASDVRGEL